MHMAPHGVLCTSLEVDGQQPGLCPPPGLVKNAAVSMGAEIGLGVPAFNSLSYTSELYLEVEVLSHMQLLSLVF